ncbi:MAG: CopG family ribbon-helix-helix protein [Alphaproteobacteria bacterium]|jgi:RHH-type rel operon transcriptional repressor/antitoxin RelB|nr:CopG family ribbon-helix-helix protein [Alphaproteobacteria bacterium]
MSKSVAMSLRLKPELGQRIERLASAVDRTKNWIVERALEEYLDRESWQVAEIRQGLIEADAGDFASTAKISALKRKFAR